MKTHFQKQTGKSGELGIIAIGNHAGFHGWDAKDSRLMRDITEDVSILVEKYEKLNFNVEIKAGYVTLADAKEFIQHLVSRVRDSNLGLVALCIIAPLCRNEKLLFSDRKTEKYAVLVDPIVNGKDFKSRVERIFNR